MILADEVTTGLDPGSKRTIWRIIEGARKGRVWVLVSHDMAEVETLCDTIGIMTFGRLRALGSPHSLKANYGGVVVLQCSYSVDADNIKSKENGNNSVIGAEANVIHCIQDLFPGAKVDGRFSGFVSFTLPQVTSDSNGTSSRLRLSQVFAIMSEHAKSAGILDWQVGQASLETVFGRLVRHCMYRGM